MTYSAEAPGFYGTSKSGLNKFERAVLLISTYSQLDDWLFFLLQDRCDRCPTLTTVPNTRTAYSCALEWTQGRIWPGLTGERPCLPEVP
jgi:hypothetical protein